MSKASKLEYLDGMRGLMAVNVLLCHFASFYYPQMMYQGFLPDKTFLGLFATTPLSVLINGNIAVEYFFVLTGFLVGRTVFTKDIGYKQACSKSFARYFRLLPVVFFAIFFTFLAMKTGLQNHLEITQLVPFPGIFQQIFNFPATLKNMLLDIFYSSFMSSSAYIGPFWTIRYEFWGYILSLFVAVFLKNKSWRIFAYPVVLVLIAILAEQNYFPFIYGILIADILCNKTPNVLEKLYSHWYKSKTFLIICFVIGTYFASCPLVFDGIHAFWAKIPMLSGVMLRGFGMALVFYVMLNSPIIQKMLSVKPVLFLGSVSFEFYALHLTLMTIVQTRLFALFIKRLPYDCSVLLSMAIFIVVLLAFSYLVHITVGKVQLRLPRRKNANIYRA